MAVKNHDVNGVIPSVRNQLMLFHGAGELQQAAKAWYEGLDEETRREVEAICVDIAGVMKQECSTPFGVGSALELLAALIAFDQGWLPGDTFRAHRLRLKYESTTSAQWRKDQREAGDE